jgi:hypothetical protein
MSLPITANAQAVAHANSVATSHANSPAKAARANLAANPNSSAAESPFGKLVSQIAKGDTPSA